MGGLAKRGNTALSSQGSSGNEECSWESKQLGENQSGKATNIRFSAMVRPHLPSTAGRWDAFQVKLVKKLPVRPPSVLGMTPGAYWATNPEDGCSSFSIFSSPETAFVKSETTKVPSH